MGSKFISFIKKKCDFYIHVFTRWAHLYNDINKKTTNFLGFKQK